MTDIISVQPLLVGAVNVTHDAFAIHSGFATSRDTHTINLSVLDIPEYLYPITTTYPSHFYVSLEQGLIVKNTPVQLSNYVSLIESVEEGVAKKIPYHSIYPVGEWPDGTCRGLHVYANIKWINGVPLTYSLEWDSYHSEIWGPSGEYAVPDDCLTDTCDDGFDQCFILCNFVGSELRWGFGSLCETPCCYCAIPDSGSVLIGTPCVNHLEGYSFPCLHTASGLSIPIFNPNLSEMGVAIVSSGDYYVVNNGTLNDIVLSKYSPIVYSGDIVLIDENDIIYQINNSGTSKIDYLDSYMVRLKYAGLLSSVSGTSFANYTTYVSIFMESDIIKYQHTTTFTDSMVYHRVKKHSIEFNNIQSGQILTRYIDKLLPYSTYSSSTGLQVLLWPERNTDTNVYTDYDIENVHKFAYLHKGSGSNALLNVVIPTGYINTLNNTTDNIYPQSNYIADLIGVGMGIDFAINVGASSDMSQHVYECNPIGLRRPNSSISYPCGIGDIGICSSGYENIDTIINNGIVGYVQNTSERYQNYGWHLFGQQHGQESYIDNRPSLSGVSENNKHNSISLAWEQFHNTADTGVLYAARIGTRYISQISQLKHSGTYGRESGVFTNNNSVLSFGFPTGTAYISGWQHSSIGDYSNPKSLLLSWYIDANPISLDGYNMWLDNVGAYVSQRSACYDAIQRMGTYSGEIFIPYTGSGSSLQHCQSYTYASYYHCNPDTELYEPIIDCPPCCTPTDEFLLSPIIGSSCYFIQTYTPFASGWATPTGGPGPTSYTGLLFMENRYPMFSTCKPIDVNPIEITNFSGTFTSDKVNTVSNILDIKALYNNRYNSYDFLHYINDSLYSFGILNSGTCLVNAQNIFYESGQLYSADWLSRTVEEYSYMGYNTDITTTGFVVNSANNIMTGTLNGSMPLALMAEAYTITQDQSYINRYVGILGQIPYMIYSGNNTSWQYYSPMFNNRVRNILSGWPRFRAVISRIGDVSIPIETGTYPNGDVTGVAPSEITNYGAKIYVYNSGGSPIATPTIQTSKLGKISTDSSLYIRTESGTVTSGLNLNFLTHTSPSALYTDLRPSTWEYFNELMSGQIPTGISQLVLGGNVAMFRPVTTYPEASLIPLWDSVLDRNRWQVSVCSGVLQSYIGDMSGSFTCTHHASGYNTAPAYVSLGGTGVWLLPEESTSFTWSGPTEFFVNCQDSSNILARFSGQEAVVGTKNIGLFGSIDHINTLIPLVSGLNY